MKKVFVSGCFDMLHSGHLYFFEQAAQFGDLYVGIGSDKTIFDLKGRKPICNEEERLYHVHSIKYIKNAWINSGNGILDFESELQVLKPDLFYVNNDGDNLEKRILCESLGIKYMVSERNTKALLPTRSTTRLLKKNDIPYRIDIAGGWLDQPFVSKIYHGSVITICIEAECEFNDQSGMATSTRKKAIELWGTELPEVKDKEKLARILFSYDNQPGTQYISGSQDALGIIMPGLNKYDYAGEYWPHKIMSNNDIELLKWLEEHLFLYPLQPRNEIYNPLSNTNIAIDKVEKLSIATQQCWDAIMNKNIKAFGKAFTSSFNAQVEMFPNMINEYIRNIIKKLQNQALGWKLSGAGGGGYLVFVAEKRFSEQLISIKIRKA